MSKAQLFLVGALILVVFVGARFFGVRGTHRAFVRDVETAVYDNWRLDNAPEAIERIIREKAQGHGIELGPDAVKIEYKRTSLGETAFVDGTWEHYQISVQAEATYHRTIIPFVPIELRAWAWNMLRRER